MALVAEVVASAVVAVISVAAVDMPGAVVTAEAMGASRASEVSDHICEVSLSIGHEISGKVPGQVKPDRCVGVYSRRTSRDRLLSVVKSLD